LERLADREWRCLKRGSGAISTWSLEDTVLAVPARPDLAEGLTFFLQSAGIRRIDSALERTTALKQATDAAMAGP
jgi:hypothetical protein